GKLGIHAEHRDTFLSGQAFEPTDIRVASAAGTHSTIWATAIHSMHFPEATKLVVSEISTMRLSNFGLSTHGHLVGKATFCSDSAFCLRQIEFFNTFFVFEIDNIHRSLPHETWKRGLPY